MTKIRTPYFVSFRVVGQTEQSKLETGGGRL